MTIFLQLLSAPVAERIGWVLVHSLWQGAVVAVLLAAALRLLRSRSAQARYVAAATALLAILSCMLVTGWTLVGAAEAAQSSPFEAAAMIAQTETDVDSSLAGSASSAFRQTEQAAVPAQASADNDFPSVNTTSGQVAKPQDASILPTDFGAEGFKVMVRPMLPWLVSGWLIGVVVFSLRLLLTWRHVGLLRTSQVTPVAEHLASAARRLADRMGLRCKVTLLESKIAEVPMVIGWLKPVILLPVAATSGLSVSQIDAILAHELAHVRRWDCPVNLLQSIVETILFYHPAVWWVSRTIRQERENCCDDIASEVCGDRVTYVRALLQLEELRQPESLVLAASGGDLAARVRRLIVPGSRSDGSVRGLAGIVALLVVCTALAGIHLTANVAAPTDDASVRKDTGQSPLTPAKIADEMEAMMKRFESVEYTAETTATVNTNGFRTDVEPVLAEGDTSYRYRSDGIRWFVDEHAFTYTQGESEVRPQHNLAGFDGALHYSLDRFGHAILGEENLSNTRLSPRAVFWRAGRTDGWLLGALRRDEAKIESDAVVNGRRVVRVVSDWKREEDHWRFEIEVLPDHSWLPVSTKVTYGGKLIGSESIQELAQANDGTWYPQRIKWSAEAQTFATTRNKTINVTSFIVRNNFKDADFEWEIPPGTPVVDHRSGIIYRNDPWFAELQPWLRESLDYPPRDMSAMRDLRSYADGNIDDKPAPPIQAAEWIVGEDPGAWKNDDGRPTILFFFGGRAISPTPKQLVVLKTLAERYKAPGLDDAGLRVVGVASASNTPAMTRQTMKELQVNFPVAIDTPNEDGRGYGRTFATFGLKAYVGIFVIDAAGIVHLVEPDLVPEDSELTALEHVLKNLDRGAIQIGSPSRESLTREQHDRLQTRWKRLASEKNGTGRITGKIEATVDGRDIFGLANVDTAQRSGVQATIELLPILGLADGSPSATLQLIAYDRVRVVTCEADGTFEIAGLCRGEYRVTTIAPGMARTEKTVILGNDAATAEVNVLLNQSGEISGTVVVEESGTPIAGATIHGTKRHFNPEYPPQHTTAHLAPKLTTGADGEFVYENLFVGAHTFRVEAAGYEPQEVPLVPAGKHGLEIVLKKLTE